MRRAVLVIVSLLLVTVVAVSVFLAFSNHKDELKYGDMLSTQVHTVTAGGDKMFQGMFKCKLKAKYICDYSYEFKDGTVYLTIYCSANKDKAIDVNAGGYASVRFKLNDFTDKVVYRACDEEKVILNLNRG